MRDGQMLILGCGEEGRAVRDHRRQHGDPADRGARSDYTLNPTFFAGEPIEDTSSGFPINRLIIRMQHDGRGIEVNNTLYFDVINSYEVARCIRGGTINGANDWLPDSAVVDYQEVPLAGQTINGTTIPTWCDWSAGREYPRIYLHPDGLVRASLVPLGACPIPPRGATTGGQRVTGATQIGWIDFVNFGGVAPAQPAPRHARAAGDRLHRSSSVQQLHANFHVDADRRAHDHGAKDEQAAAGRRASGGVLDGFFDFDFARGRAAQGFP